MWSLDGECLQQYIGHESFVYGIAGINGVQSFVTCGEDQQATVWRGKLNALSIVSCLTFSLQTANLSSPSDTLVRCGLFSTENQALGLMNSSLVAAMALLGCGQKIQHSLSLRMKWGPITSRYNSTVSLGVDLISLLIRNQVLQDSQARASHSAGQTINGVNYDFVWNVDLGDGSPALYLGYNRGGKSLTLIRGKL